MDFSVKVGGYIDNELVEFEKGINTNVEYYQKLKTTMKLMSADCPLIRIGNVYDGGYVMLNDFKEGAVAYSFGINDDVSWDKGMADRGYDVYMYDPTIDGLPYENKCFHFFKQGLAGITDEETSMDTLENFILKNGHQNNKNMILKIDIEGFEWEFLYSVTSEILNQFDQILFEFHEMIEPKSIESMSAVLYCLSKLNITHQLVHLHGNNCDFSVKINGHCFPNAIEATYVNKSKYKLSEHNGNLPLIIDAPNDRGRDDLNLNSWNIPIYNTL